MFISQSALSALGKIGLLKPLKMVFRNFTIKIEQELFGQFPGWAKKVVALIPSVKTMTDSFAQHGFLKLRS